MHRKNAIRSVAFLGFVVAAACTGHGADHPINGYYTSSNHRSIGLEEAQKKCALTFFRAEPDGSFVNYALDIERFLRTKEILYVTTGRGACNYDHDSKTEKCNWIASVADESSSPIQFFSYYNHISSASADGLTFLDEQAMRAFAKHRGGAESSRFAKGVLNTYCYHRCKDIRGDAISRYLSSSRNPLTREQMDRLESMIESSASGGYEVSKRVLDRIRASQ